MHAEVQAFLNGVREVEWDGALVYEVGALNVNGRARDCVPSGWHEWVGFDLLDGDSVDVPGDAIVTLPGRDPADVIVSTEVLEHCERWADLLGVMCDVLRPGGWLVVTCAGTGRAPHSASGAHELDPWEHYRNVTLEEVRTTCEAHGVFIVYGEEGFPGDTRYLGRKDV